MNIGEIIRQERKNKGITQDELARRLGITRSAVGQFEKKDSNFRYETLKKIADAMDIPVYKLSLNEGERIKAVRESIGLTQKELGEKVGLSAENIADIENQDLRPSNSLLFQLAKALNTSAFTLVPGLISPADETEKINRDNDSIEGLKAIIRKLHAFTFIDPEPEENHSTNIHFTENEHSYHISEADLMDLVPLVDGLVEAYINQKKVCDS